MLFLMSTVKFSASARSGGLKRQEEKKQFLVSNLKKRNDKHTHVEI